MNNKKILRVLRVFCSIVGLIMVVLITWGITPAIERTQKSFEEVSDILNIENLWIPFIIIIVCVILISSLIGLKLLSLEESGLKKGSSLGLIVSVLVASIMATTKEFDFLLFFKVLGLGIIIGVIFLFLRQPQKETYYYE